MTLKKLLIPLTLTIALTACDDTTDQLGTEMMPTTDLTQQVSQTYNVYTQSYSAGDSVLARTSRSYLGRFTDPETGTCIKSDFLAQFHCIEDFAFPDSVIGDSIISTELLLYVDNYVGDSLATFKISVYPLTKVLDPDADYYTNIDPERYCDIEAEPITVKWYTLSDRTVDDETRRKSTYSNHIRIPLPKSIGTQIYEAYKNNPQQFRNSESWINSGLSGSKGFYFRLESGDGALAYINIIQFNINLRYHDAEENVDTTGMCQFAATEEVIQATRFENTNLEKLLDDTQATYLKSPAGIFTMATLPANQLNYNDTINSASLTLTRYNDQVNNGFKLGIPKYLLMVRLDDYNNGYFEQYKTADANTSFLAKFDAGTNTYQFINISHLLITMMQELRNGTATENYNKVLLIPVEPTFDSTSSSTTTVTNESTSTLVKLCHDFSMTSARLVGGENNPIQLRVIYSKFNK